MINDHQRITTPRSALLIGGHNVLCPEGCGFIARGWTEWMAVHRLGEHLITAHVSPLWTRDEQKAS